MSIKSTYQFVCDVCDTTMESNSGITPSKWAQWELKTVNGSAYQERFHACGRCNECAVNAEGQTLFMNPAAVFKQAFKKFFGVKI